MGTDLHFTNWLFDVLPELKQTFGNRRNWQRFCLIANHMALDLRLRRHGEGRDFLVD